MNKKRITDTKFWAVLTLAGNGIGLNLLFIVACLPVVTIGPALCGLYSGVRYMIKKEGWFHGFCEGFRTHFIRTGIAGVLCVVFQAYVLMQFNDALSFYLQKNFGLEFVISYGIMAIIPAMIAASLWPLNIYIPYGTADWLRNAVSMIFKAPGPVLLAACLFLLPVVLVLFLTVYAYYSVLVIVAGWFALSAFAATLFYKDSLLDLLADYRIEHPEDSEDYEEADTEEET